MNTLTDSEIFGMCFPGSEWFHGGRGGLEPGDLLIPRSMSGEERTSSLKKEREPHDRRFVFVTPSKRLASRFARKRKGRVYLVEPDASTLSMTPLARRVVKQSLALDPSAKVLASFNWLFIEAICKHAVVKEVLK